MITSTKAPRPMNASTPASVPLRPSRRKALLGSEDRHTGDRAGMTSAHHRWPSDDLCHHRAVSTPPWRDLSPRDLLRRAWWRPLPGIVVGAVIVALVWNPVLGVVLGVVAWLATLGCSALFVLGAPPYGPIRRRR